MTKLEFLTRAFVAHNEQLKTLADNQRELLGVIVELKNKGEWVGLTDEEIQDCIRLADRQSGAYKKVPWAQLLAAKIEAKLKEKNG